MPQKETRTWQHPLARPAFPSRISAQPSPRRSTRRRSTRSRSARNTAIGPGIITDHICGSSRRARQAAAVAEQVTAAANQDGRYRRPLRGFPDTHPLFTVWGPRADLRLRPWPVLENAARKSRRGWPACPPTQLRARSRKGHGVGVVNSGPDGPVSHTCASTSRRPLNARARRSHHADRSVRRPRAAAPLPVFPRQRLVSRIVDLLPPVTEALPVCRIRSGVSLVSTGGPRRLHALSASGDAELPA